MTDLKQQDVVLLEAHMAVEWVMDGISKLDDAGRYVYVNPGYAIMLGYQPDELIGQSWEITVHPDDRASVAEIVERMLVTGKAEGEFRGVKKNGSLVHKHVVIVKPNTPQGKMAGHYCFARDITERKHIEQALRASEEQWQLAVKGTNDGIWDWDLRTNEAYFSERWKNMIGYEEHELPHSYREWESRLHPDDQARVMSELTAYLQNQRNVYDVEFRLRKKDGTYCWIQARGQAMRDADGRAYRMAGSHTDITERKRADEHLRRTQFAMDQAVDAVYWIDPSARILYTNEAASVMLGYTADEFLHMTVHDLNPDFPPEVWPGWWKETREKKVVSLETVHVRKDGRRIPIDIRVSFLAHEGQEFHCAFVRDISERKRVDEVLRASRERFELAVRASNDGIWDWDILTGVQHWSDRHFELFGCVPGDFTPTYDLWISMLHPDDAALVHQATHRHLDTREPYDIEARVRMNDGSYRWFRDRGQAVWDSAGRPLRMVGSTSDITEQREAEGLLRNAHAELEQRVAERTEQLAQTNRSLQEEIAERTRAEETIRESEMRYKLLTDATFDGIAIHDQGILLEVNPGLERMFGYEPGELIGRPMWDLIAEDCRDLVLANMRSGVTGPYEAIGLRKDGTKFPGEVVVRPYRYRGKDVRLVAGRDITERKRLEAQMARHTEELEQQIADRTAKISELMELRAKTEKLAAMGQLAAGVAHEINNPIAGVKNAFELVKQAVDPAHPHYEFVGMIDREISRVAAIVQNMYLLYKQQQSRTIEPVQVSRLCRELQELLTKPLVQKNLSFTVDVPEALATSLVVPQSDLFQVLLNLTQNAIDCSPPGGRITVSLREESDVVRLAVSDQGSGIAPDVLPHIFDPFYTTKTKRDQKGMGLGLSISQSLVQAMGGSIEVETQAYRGSTFTVCLPRSRVAQESTV